MESDWMQKHRDHLLEEETRNLAENRKVIQAFQEYAASLGLGLNKGNFEYVRSIGIIVSYPNIVATVLDSSPIQDKEGLYSWNELLQKFRKKYSDGFLFAEKFMLMAHSFFRRGLYKNANFAPRFVNLFWNDDFSKAEAGIAIDMDRLRINVDDSVYMEKDTWYGARFTKDIESIKDGLVKIAPPAGYSDTFNEMFFDSNRSLDILWTSYQNIKEFQLEEIKSDRVVLSLDGILYHPVRYIHSEYDISARRFRHFDGAVHLYTEEEFQLRKNSDLNFNKKTEKMVKPKSTKVFRFNGNLEIDFWIKYCSHFLTGNPLVIEYFEGDYPDDIKEILEKGKEIGI